jgi:hypothetical protein
MAGVYREMTEETVNEDVSETYAFGRKAANKAILW